MKFFRATMGFNHGTTFRPDSNLDRNLLSPKRDFELVLKHSFTCVLTSLFLDIISFRREQLIRYLMDRSTYKRPPYDH